MSAAQSPNPMPPREANTSPETSAPKKTAKKMGRPRARETKLSRWIDEHRGGDRKSLAAELGIRIGYLNELARGDHFPGRELTFKLIEKSLGKLTFEDLQHPTQRFL